MPKSTYTPKSIARGQVWFVTGDPDCPPVGSEMWPDRYAVIVSANPIAAKSGFVTVVYATTSPNKVSKTPMSPTHVLCRISGKDAVLLCEQPTTVDKSRLQRYSHTIRNSVLHKIDQALCASLSLSKIDCSAAYAKWEKRIANGTAQIIDLNHDDTVSNPDVGKLIRENARLKAERDSYRTLLRVREDADAEVTQTA